MFYRFLSYAFHCALVAGLLALAANPCGAGVLVEPGQRSLLTVSVTVQGEVEQSKGYRDEVVKWSTKRAFAATVEMAADKPEKMGFGAEPGGEQQALLADLQKQTEACGEDQACQMRVAMQLMNAPGMQASIDSPPRLQGWRPVEDSNRLKVSGSYQETLYTVFYTAVRETTDCTLTAPAVSAELTKAKAASGDSAEQQNREMLEKSGLSFVVQVDDTEKSAVLIIGSLLNLGSGDTKCVQDMGAGPETSHQSTNAALLPAGAVKLPLEVKGTASEKGVIASGATSFEVPWELNTLGVGFATDVSTPLQVAVRWQLKAL